MTRIITSTYQISFTTPAFIGDAEQRGRWRAPPFKALLRQWWRVAVAAEFNFDHSRMRQVEGKLFGNAWLDKDFSKSVVRLRLAVPTGDAVSAWRQGTQQGVSPMRKNIDTSYAWFGLVDRGGGEPDRSAIKPEIMEGRRLLQLAYPEANASSLSQAIGLINGFGNLGSRARGGWGSIMIDDLDVSIPMDIERCARPLSTCLSCDWASSFVLDGGLWIWESHDLPDSWDKVMAMVAAERKTVRSALKSINGQDLRSALGFAGNGRMPSPLRWKVVRLKTGRVRIRVFAMPHRLPADSPSQLNGVSLEKAWRTISEVMDDSARFRAVSVTK